MITRYKMDSNEIEIGLVLESLDGRFIQKVTIQLTSYEQVEMFKNSMFKPHHEYNHPELNVANLGDFILVENEGLGYLCSKQSLQAQQALNALNTYMNDNKVELDEDVWDV